MEHGAEGDAVDSVGALRAKYGVFFVTGNHEYYAGPEECLKKMKSLGVRVLQNERVTIGEGNAVFDLAGVNDPAGYRETSEYEEAIARTFQGIDPRHEVVLLAHRPKQVLFASAHNVGLQLSGHTHGGQIWPFNLIVGRVEPFVSGMARQGRTQLYVNEGAGFWGPPMRLGTRAEITLFTLIASAPH